MPIKIDTLRMQVYLSGIGGVMKKEEIVILDNGVDVEEIAAVGNCCKGPQAPVR